MLGQVVVIEVFLNNIIIACCFQGFYAWDYAILLPFQLEILYKMNIVNKIRVIGNCMVNSFTTFGKKKLP